MCKTRQITSIDTALRIRYSFPEIGNKEIEELFGKASSATVAKWKKAVIDVQNERDIKTMGLHTVNTEVAYEVWGIDVSKLERMKAKCEKLGLTA